MTNVIGFALLYWELDRGGPVARREARRDEIPPADRRFSQDENDDAVTEVAAGSSKKSRWIPAFVDYLYLSPSNSSAFSPTDTMPLTNRAKILMGIEATAPLLTSLLVIARAVGSRRRRRLNHAPTGRSTRAPFARPPTEVGTETSSISVARPARSQHDMGAPRPADAQMSAP